MNTKDRIEKIKQLLEDKKAEHITLIDLHGKSSMTEYMLIASGTSQRHIASLASQIREEMHKYKITPLSMEGYPDSDWILLDLNDIIVHLFKPETRLYYNLEKIWIDGETLLSKKRQKDFSGMGTNIL